MKKPPRRAADLFALLHQSASDHALWRLIYNPKSLARTIKTMLPRNMGLYLPRLNQLRYIAAAMVVFSHSWDMFFHAPQADGWGMLFFRVGDAGVALFFVMSGFLFTHLAETARTHRSAERFIDYRKFLYNRAVRILPLLVFMYAVSLACKSHDITISDVLMPALLLANSGAAVKTGYPMLWAITWTIAVEFQFYLIFPFLYQFAVKNGIRYLFGVIGLMMALRFSAHFAEFDYGSQMSYTTLPYRIDQFVLGMVLALLPREKISESIRIASLFIACGAAIALALLYVNQEAIRIHYAGHAWFSTAEGFGWAAIVGASLLTEIGTRGIIARSLASLGTVSYSLYLSHLFVILPVTKAVRSMTGWTWSHSDPHAGYLYPLILIIILPLATALAALTYAMIEKPFFQFRTTYYRPPKAQLSPVEIGMEKRQALN